MEDQELRSRGEITDRLSQRFGTPTDEVRRLVDAGFDGFRSAKVRDYIDLLVEREVSDVLRTRARQVPAQRRAPEGAVVLPLA